MAICACLPGRERPPGLQHFMAQFSEVLSVIEMLLLPGRRRDGAVRVHDDFCTANDHHNQEKAEEDETC